MPGPRNGLQSRTSQEIITDPGKSMSVPVAERATCAVSACAALQNEASSDGRIMLTDVQRLSLREKIEALRQESNHLEARRDVVPTSAVLAPSVCGVPRPAAEGVMRAKAHACDVSPQPPSCTPAAVSALRNEDGVSKVEASEAALNSRPHLASMISVSASRSVEQTIAEVASPMRPRLRIRAAKPNCTDAHMTPISSCVEAKLDADLGGTAHSGSAPDRKRKKKKKDKSSNAMFLDCMGMPASEEEDGAPSMRIDRGAAHRMIKHYAGISRDEVQAKRCRMSAHKVARPGRPRPKIPKSVLVSLGALVRAPSQIRSHSRLRIARKNLTNEIGDASASAGLSQEVTSISSACCNPGEEDEDLAQWVPSSSELSVSSDSESYSDIGRRILSDQEDCIVPVFD